MLQVITAAEATIANAIYKTWEVWGRVGVSDTTSSISKVHGEGKNSLKRLKLQQHKERTMLLLFHLAINCCIHYNIVAGV